MIIGYLCAALLVVIVMALVIYCIVNEDAWR